MISKKIFLLLTLTIIPNVCQTSDNEKKPSRYRTWKKEHQQRKDIHAKRRSQEAKNKKTAKNEHERRAIHEQSKAQESKEKAAIDQSHHHAWRQKHKERKAEHAQRVANLEKNK